MGRSLLRYHVCDLALLIDQAHNLYGSNDASKHQRTTEHWNTPSQDCRLLSLAVVKLIEEASGSCISPLGIGAEEALES